VRRLSHAIGALLALSVGAPSSVAGDDAGLTQEIESTIQRDGSTHRIRVRVREATLQCGWRGEVGRYSVWRDGRFLHPADPQGGHLVGCRYTALGFTVRPFPNESGPVGWLLSTMAGCGVRSHHRHRLVLSPRRGFCDEYEEITFDSAPELVVRERDGAIEVWGSEERADRGAVSLFLPFVARIGDDLRARRVPLDPNPSTWAEPYSNLSWPIVYAVGLDQRDGAMMRAAVPGTVQPDTARWIETLGLPPEIDRLLELAEEVERVAAAERRIRAIVTSELASPPR
jgi:hypothetical protein